MARGFTVAVIGAGVLGRSIAHAAALGGYRTVVEDLLPGSLRKAEHEFRAYLDQAISSGQVSIQEARIVFDSLLYAESVEEAARQADLVVEAVPEELESKSEIFILLDKICRPATILVTSTSILSVTQLSSVTYRAARCVGMRFVHPVYKMKRLEIVRGRETSDEILAAASTFGMRMGKEIVVVEEDTATAPEMPS